MIHAQGLRKRYGDVVAVDDLTFTIKPGIVTGFLGPNGSGKSTTMRMIVGLDAPTSGSVTANGMRYAGHSAPIHEVGALLEAKAIHPGRTARNHLLSIAAATTGIPPPGWRCRRCRRRHFVCGDGRLRSVVRGGEDRCFGLLRRYPQPDIWNRRCRPVLGTNSGRFEGARWCGSCFGSAAGEASFVSRGEEEEGANGRDGERRDW